MTDNTVGEVSIRVKPDTSKFAKELKEGVDKALKKVQAELEKNALKIKLDVDHKAQEELQNKVDKTAEDVEKKAKKITLKVDLSRKAEVQAAMERLRQELKDQTRDPVKIKVKLDDQASIKEAISRLVKADNKIFADARRRADETLGQIKIHPAIDKESLKRVRDEIAADFERMDALKFQVKGELSKREKTKLKLELESIRADIKTKLNTVSLVETELELDAFARRKRDIEFDTKIRSGALEALKRLTGFRLGMGMFTEFKDFLTNIDKKVPLVGSMTLAIGGLAGTAIAAAGDIFSLSRALAQIGPGALALPGLFGGMAVGLAATAVVMKDFNKEFSNLAIGYGRNLKAGTAWKQLQNSMSSTFWAKVRKPMADMISVVFPQVSKGLMGTSRALATFFSNLSKSFKTELGGSAVTAMFGALNISIENFAKHTDAIARLVKIFGLLGTRQLPAVANWAGKVADKFAAFMTNAQNTGKLDRWIATAVNRLQALGRVVVNLAKIFRGLAVAADNATAGDALNNLAKGLGKVAKWVNSPAIQKRLTAVFTAAHTMMSRIAQRSGPAFSRYMASMSQNLLRLLPRVGDAIGTLFGGLFDYLGDPKLQNGLFNLVDGLAKGLESLRPVVSNMAAKTGELLTVLGDLAQVFGKVLAAKISALTPLMTLFLTVLDGFVRVLNLIPGPVFEVIAALVVWNKISTLLAAGSLVSIGKSLLRLIPGFGLFSKSVTSSTIALEGNTAATAQNTAAQTAAATRMGALRGAIGMLAGAGGLLLLAHGFQRGSTEAKGFGTALEKTLGGALLGLSQRGPVGAAVGATAGLAASFKDLQRGWSNLLGVDPDGVFGQITRKSADAAQKAATAMDKYNTSLIDLQSTLDQMTGASTTDTRVQALSTFSDQYKDLYTHLKSIGVTDREISLAVTGNKQATNAIMQALAGKEGLAGVDPTTQFHQYADALNDVTIRTKKAADNTRQAATVTQDLSALYKSFPNRVASQINIEGIKPTYNGVKKIAEQYHVIDKRKLTALISASGWKPTKRQVDSLISSLNGVSKAKPNLGKFQAAVTKGVGDAKGKAKVPATALANVIGLPLQNMKPDLKKFTTNLSSKLTGQKAPAKGDAKGIANFIIAGLQEGLSSQSGTIGSVAASIIRNAIARMRAEAKIHSPSRETIAVGSYMGQGLVIGLGKHKGELLGTAKSLIGMLVKGLSGSESVAFKKRLDSIMGLIPKGLSKDKRKSLTHALTPEQKDLEKLYGKWSAIATQIKSKIKSIYDAADQLKQQVVSSVVALGDPTQIDGADQGMTFDAIEQNMAQALDKAKRFATVLKQLRKLKLNNDTFMQLVNAGPDAALASAEAIQQAGQAGVDALNQQQHQLDQFAQQAGQTARQQYINNGMAMAEGMLKGLRDKRKDLEAEMTSIAGAMVRTIKQQLGIHSPSRVFRKLGNHTGDGFVRGIKDTRRDVESAMNKLVAFRATALPGFSGDSVAPAGATAGARTLNYYAAPGESLSAEERLWAAFNRARSNGF